ncbi:MULTISPECIES: DUF2345 domain-containing protein [Caballeronia]|uniref:DUF2345 domain-containing protein n=1 Tax=Caballeronia TaxID=1827195 RepID=UPI00158D732D|nr:MULTISPECIES: DUF2345 domain-containing protein [Caballeronia]MCG7404283.1 DUF2345 domain-containing protein [Caballeronia zhejiangensis]MCI1045824.1 DUF2345 domain-containing protein [Caballeronia zhejiangensis]
MNQLTQPGVFVSAPASIGLASGKSVQVSARDNITAVAGKNFDVSALKRFSVAVGEAVSLFAQKMGIKLFAGRGSIDIEAQTDAMSLLSAKDLTVSSADGSVRVKGKREIVLESGGAFIRIADGNVTIGGPGDLILKVITMQKQGAATLHEATAVLPKPAGLFDEQFTLRDEHSGEILSYHPYRIETADGEIHEGITDVEGRTVRVYTGKGQGLNIFKG